MTLTERAHLSVTQGVGPSGQPKGERGERACAPEQGRPVSWAARSALGHGERGGGSWVARETRPSGPKAS